MSEIQKNEYDDTLNRKIEYWKSELLDTGKRNKMINYRETKRTTLRILWQVTLRTAVNSLQAVHLTSISRARGITSKN